MLQLHLFIFGRVQGVGFRYFVRGEARKKNINGWVKNLSDGSVEAILQGEKSDLEQILGICSKGTDLSRINKIDAQYEEGKELQKFEVH